jgi:hypothetical protein
MVATRTTLPDLNTLDRDALQAILLMTHEKLVVIQEQLVVPLAVRSPPAKDSPEAAGKSDRECARIP